MFCLVVNKTRYRKRAFEFGSRKLFLNVNRSRKHSTSFHSVSWTGSLKNFSHKSPNALRFNTLFPVCDITKNKTL